MSQEYEEVVRKNEASVGEYQDDHPAFAVIQISRVSSGGKIAMFGSRTKTHPTFVRLRITRASRQYGLARDWIFGENSSVVEVDMTSLQFSDMLTNMNVGSGVPCTLRQIEGKNIPWIPEDDDNELGRIIEHTQSTIKKDLLDRRLPELKTAIHDILDAKGQMKAAQKEKLKGLLFEVTRVVEDHLPFSLKQFGSSADKIKTEVRRDISSFATMMVERAGIKALSGMTHEEQVNLLTDGEEEK